MKKERIRLKDLTIMTHWHNGMLEIYATVGSYLVSRRYMGYTKRHAASMFLKEANGKEEMT